MLGSEGMGGGVSGVGYSGGKGVGGGGGQVVGIVVVWGLGGS